jgi:homoserine O-acetyltransferase
MSRLFKSLIAVAGVAALAGGVLAQTPAPLKVDQGDFVLRDFRFHDGGSLPELRIHYRTLGAPHRDAAGRIDNAVLILHGTGGSGAQFLRPQFADELFGPGQLLDVRTHFIVLPDDIGHGGSSKPSDGLRMRFPHYDYDDMVRAEHALVTERLGIAQLLLLMGTSMGCMHAFMWGEAWPEAARALMPLACLPVAIAGRNRLWRRMAIEGIEADPAWQGGGYSSEPADGLRLAGDILTMAGSAPRQMQKTMPTPADVDRAMAGPMAKAYADVDANDLIFQLDSSRDYDPSAGLERISAPVMWVNSADDFINPPELGIAEPMSKRLAHGRFVLLPVSDLTHGHGTHTWAAAWKTLLAELLAATGG